ncbi:MAG: DUF1559 domain-containing protein [Planctomycetaceae bacterium]|nr:DUF1559 domain-containing protein [Planctomycetaceae bacterium]
MNRSEIRCSHCHRPVPLGATKCECGRIFVSDPEPIVEEYYLPQTKTNKRNKTNNENQTKEPWYAKPPIIYGIGLIFVLLIIGGLSFYIHTKSKYTAKLTELAQNFITEQLENSGNIKFLSTVNIRTVGETVMSGKFKGYTPTEISGEVRIKNKLIKGLETRSQTEYKVECYAKPDGSFEPYFVLLDDKVIFRDVNINCSVNDHGLCALRMKQIWLAIRNYVDTYISSFPPAYSVSKEDKKPLHSWRVLLLPFLGKPQLYINIHHDEPWDSEYNKQFHNQCPQVFRCPNKNSPEGMSDYAVVMGLTIAFDENQGTTVGKMARFDETVILIERKEPVEWMKPDSNVTDKELFNSNRDNSVFGSPHRDNGSNFILADGTHISAKSISSFNDQVSKLKEEREKQRKREEERRELERRMKR